MSRRGVVPSRRWEDSRMSDYPVLRPEPRADAGAGQFDRDPV
ncbi:hypothetical protein [Inquilinus limosus]|nr:hypothetical protein [Inquilinus limosus]